MVQVNVLKMQKVVLLMNTKSTKIALLRRCRLQVVCMYG